MPAKTSLGSPRFADSVVEQPWEAAEVANLVDEVVVADVEAKGGRHQMRSSGAT